MKSQLSKPFVMCLMGPTASGKTALAVELVQRYPFSIISVDSTMVYRGMNIGTAKPTEAILKQAPHRLIDLLDPNESYSAGTFRNDAMQEIQAIHAQGRIPLLVGGTMMYFRVLQQGLATLPTANAHLRTQLQNEATVIGWEALHHRLSTIDPLAAKRIHPSDAQRIQRALEVYLVTGQTISSYQNQNSHPLSAFEIFNLVVAPQNRALLHERMAQRFNQMISLGFVDESKQLFERGDLTKNHPAMRAVGYREMWDYHAGLIAFEDACAKAIVSTRQLAKRQLTWLRSWPNAHWFEAEDAALFSKVNTWIDSIVVPRAGVNSGAGPSVFR